MTIAIAATEVKTRFDHYLDASLLEPVEIEQKGQSVAVIISKLEFDRLSALDDAYWLDKAHVAEQEGCLSEYASLALLTENA